jgi:type I restriction enzyme S subunit
VAAPSTWNPARVDGNTAFTYIDLTAVDQNSKVIATPRQVLAREAPSRARQVVAHRDVLVSTVRPNLNAVALVPISLDSAIASTGFCVLRSNPTSLDSSYLFHWVKTPEFVSQMVRRATGASYPAVSDRIVLSSEIPLPPLSEQRRIAGILDQADALQTKRRAALDEVDALTGSAFIEMFGNPASDPMGFPVGALGDVATFVGGGTPSRAIPEYFAGTICWATSKDMKARFLDDTQEHVTPAAVQASATKVVPAGTILVVVKSKVLMHRLPVAISRVDTCFGQDLKGIVVDETCHPSYVATALRMNASWLLRRARGINTEGLTLDHLRRFPLLLPSKSKQQGFAHFADEQELLHQRMSASIDELDDLLASLQHRAFRGEL